MLPAETALQSLLRRDGSSTPGSRRHGRLCSCLDRLWAAYDKHRNSELRRGAYRVGMTGVTAYENPMVKCVFLGEALRYWIDRVPYHTIPLDVVRLQYPFRCGLNLCLGGALCRVPIFVGRGCNLYVKPYHIVFPWDYHHGAMIRMDRAFQLSSLVSMLCSKLISHTLMSGKSVRTTPSMTPQT